AYDLFPRIVALTVPPSRASRRVVADQRDLVGPPDLLEPYGRVAAVIAWIEPKRLVPIEVSSREDVDRQRFDAVGHIAVAGGIDRRVTGRHAGAGPITLAFGADDVGRHERVRGSPPDAFLGQGRHPCGSASTDQERKVYRSPFRTLHLIPLNAQARSRPGGRQNARRSVEHHHHN